ncbi:MULTISPECIES: hypothetical protein [Pseudomonas]|uniref:hypothetical protein n=1 Tax=Pseudomonas TaxID=286 RepID=UPI0008E339A0|nr:hypothetical protein [Pseudomonas marincola]MBQ54208.1 hypothetical protein [Pseudomonadaceae bacterium]SFT92599.1 hypothetical protein SAMN05216264_106163 [Pseudomonas marincola]HCP57449.1 hypothetical protein [Pseudomonas sp.]
MLKFIKTTALGGLLFILPLLLIGLLIEKAIHLLQGPIHKLLPVFEQHAVAGITLFTLAACLVLVLICFLAGLLATTDMAKNWLQSIEDHLLEKIPGYRLIQDTLVRFAGIEDAGAAQVALLVEGDGWQFCLVLESDEYWSSVFIPDGGPAGCSAGAVRVMPTSELRITDVPWIKVLACLRHNGAGGLELAKPYLADVQPVAG